MKSRQTKILGLALLLGGLALGGVGLWLLLSPAHYRATAIISIFIEVNDSGGGVEFQVQPYYPYDPYRVQATCESIQSPVVLSNAVVKINLNEKSAGNIENSSPVDIHNTIKLLKRKLNLFPVRGNRPLNSNPEGLYMGIAISVTDTNASKAAAIANAVAEAYIDYNLNMLDELVKKQLEILQQQYQDEEKNLSRQPTNREQLLENHKLFAAKIEAETMNWKATRRSRIQIVDRAEPPQSPIYRNDSLGVILMIIGMLPLLGGFLFLKPSRQPAV